MIDTWCAFTLLVRAVAEWFFNTQSIFSDFEHAFQAPPQQEEVEQVVPSVPEPELEPEQALSNEPEPEERLLPGWHRSVTSSGRTVYINYDLNLAQFRRPGSESWVEFPYPEINLNFSLLSCSIMNHDALCLIGFYPLQLPSMLCLWLSEVTLESWLSTQDNFSDQQQTSAPTVQQEEATRPLPERVPERRLPPGWRSRVGNNGRVVYINDELLLAQYHPPELLE